MTYPTSIPTFTTKFDGVDYPEAEHINTLQSTLTDIMNNVPAKYSKTTAPTSGDDSDDGYRVGDIWLDTTNDLIYEAIDVSVGAAVWIELVGRTQTQTLTNKTLTTPTIASFTNATHAHKSAAGGGQINTYLPLYIQAPSTTVADATTLYIGNESTFSTTESQHNPTTVPIAGTIVAVYLSFRNLNGASASGETSTIYLRINETTDVQISNAVVNNSSVTSFSATGLSTSVSAGDRLIFKWNTPTWATDPTSVNFSATILMTVSVV